MPRILRGAIVIASALCLLACEGRSHPASNFVAVRADKTVSASSAYPLAVDPSRVGTYPADTKSGGGFFYDDVLEYRVWLHPENGAQPLNATHDYYVAFAQYEPAAAFAKNSRGAEDPLVLVRQLEWINEPEPGHYVPKRGERITEWQVRWLAGDKRSANTITEFMKHPHPARD
jgi:hypothetical protein